MKPDNVDPVISVESSKVELGDALCDHARESIRKVASKYFGKLDTAAVHFSKEGINYRCSVNIQMGALPVKSGAATDKDIYLAFSTALEKVAKQLRRTKRELREDQGERVDKDVFLREGLGRTTA